MTSLFSPLSDDELQELDNFLLFEVDCDEYMTLDTLDGYLHAIAIGPVNLNPKQWMPDIWGDGIRPNFVNKWWSWSALDASPANWPRSLAATTSASVRGFFKPKPMRLVVAGSMRPEPLPSAKS